jgi:hypothetical protein
MKRLLEATLLIGFVLIGLLLLLPTGRSSAFSGNSACDKSVSQGGDNHCGPYDAYELQSYLSSTSPSGATLGVGYSLGSTCGNGNVNMITAGHYGLQYNGAQDTEVCSLYTNPSSYGQGTVSFDATDYWTFN